MRALACGLLLAAGCFDFTIPPRHQDLGVSSEDLWGSLDSIPPADLPDMAFAAGTDFSGLDFGPTCRSASFAGGRVEVPTHAGLHPIGAFTLEAWIRPSASRTGLSFIAGVGGASTNVSYALILDTSGRVGAVLEDENGNRLEVVGTGSAVSSGSWTHVAMTLATTGPAPQLTLYVSGLLVGTPMNPAFSASALALPGAPFEIGNSVAESLVPFVGEIDEVRLSAGVRYTSSGFALPPRLAVEPATTVLYHFDEVGVPFAADAQVNRHDGTLIADASFLGACPP